MNHLGLARLHLCLVDEQFDGGVPEPGFSIGAMSDAYERLSELLRKLYGATIGRSELLGYAQLGGKCP